MVIGNINAEGAAMLPLSPMTPERTTTTHRSSYSIEHHALRLEDPKLRVAGAYPEAKREPPRHGVEMEKAFIWGIPTETNGLVPAVEAIPNVPLAVSSTSFAQTSLRTSTVTI
jgi:hypothetical protein